MRDFDPELSIEVKGKERIVRLPGSNYLVTYFKREGSTTSAYALHFGSVTRKDMALCQRHACRAFEFEARDREARRIKRATVLPSVAHGRRSRAIPLPT